MWRTSVSAVHPRACGEQFEPFGAFWTRIGSSPRLRGTGDGQHGLAAGRRFIPAPAGNSPATIGGPRLRPVHPRACGEQARVKLHPSYAIGSSPRLRGTVNEEIQPLIHVRFIPAPAGNRLSPISVTRDTTVHPRACGEQPEPEASRRSLTGSSPRLRGTAPRCPPRSPPSRFIPAPAGNSAPCGSPPAAAAVHPRACGEQRRTLTTFRSHSGSSPRLRGTAGEPLANLHHYRFIPAPAGNSTDPWPNSSRTPVHPRACGEQILFACASPCRSGSSPRLRGTGPVRQGIEGRRRFIPAPAGNSRRSSRIRASVPVHPRACGEQLTRIVNSRRASGSSPRLRGTVAELVERDVVERFIPAPAGNSGYGPTRASTYPVHPRACGEQPVLSAKKYPVSGSSPRLRGTDRPGPRQS